MASPTTSQILYRTVPGAGSQALRNINKAWHISDVALVIPCHLHPRNEHRSNQWNAQFQKELEALSRIVYEDELAEFSAKCQATVDIRCNVKPRHGKRKRKRVTYLTLDDLVSINRVFRHKRTAELDREKENERFMLEAARVKVFEHGVDVETGQPSGSTPTMCP